MRPFRVIIRNVDTTGGLLFVPTVECVDGQGIFDSQERDDLVSKDRETAIANAKTLAKKWGIPCSH